VQLRDDDLPLLEEIRARTGIGLLCRRPGQNARPTAYWEVLRKHDVAELVRILDAYPLRSRKRRDYEVWRRAVGIAAARGGSTTWGRSSLNWRLGELKRELEVVRQYDSPPAPDPPAVAEPEALF
jgi:hypothetical protein